MAKKPNYTARRIVAGGVAGGAAAAGASALGSTDTSYVPKVTEQFIQDPNSDVPHSVLTQHFSMVPPETMPVHEVLQHAADWGVKGAILGAGAVAVHHGYMALKNRNLGRQFNK